MRFTAVFYGISVAPSFFQGEETMKKAKREISVSQAAQPSAVEAILAIAAEMARRLGENISKVQLQSGDAALNRLEESRVSKAR